MRKDRLVKLEKRIKHLERRSLVLIARDGVITDSHGKEYEREYVDRQEAEGRGVLVISRCH